MVRVAEEGGRLDHALKTAATYLERQAELRKRLIYASMYPLVMLTISTVSVLVLVVCVLPRFATIFTKMGVEVPGPTRFMLSIGDAVRMHPLVVVGVLLAVVIGTRYFNKTPAAA